MGWALKRRRTRKNQNSMTSHTQTTTLEGVRSFAPLRAQMLPSLQASMDFFLTQFAKDVEKATLRDLSERLEGIRNEQVSLSRLSQGESAIKPLYKMEALSDVQKEIEKSITSIT